ncbi:MAG: cation transporter [Deltaproteobacteria bacterium]|nr:cation transporter [Deltaproteobacteria bacterium]MBI3076620.1 cation transporter [Deltaproteobacteria bacterium]
MERLPGVRWADVSLQKAEARVQFEEGTVETQALVDAVNRIGFQARLLRVTEPLRPTLRIEGLTSRREIERAREALAAVPGVRSVALDRKSGEVFVEHDGSKVTAARLAQVLREAGFRARPVD